MRFYNYFSKEHSKIYEEEVTNNNPIKVKLSSNLMRKAKNWCYFTLTSMVVLGIVRV